MDINLGALNKQTLNFLLQKKQIEVLHSIHPRLLNLKIEHTFGLLFAKEMEISIPHKCTGNVENDPMSQS